MTMEMILLNELCNNWANWQTSLQEMIKEKNQKQHRGLFFYEKQHVVRNLHEHDPI